MGGQGYEDKRGQCEGAFWDGRAIQISILIMVVVTQISACPKTQLKLPLKGKVNFTVCKL